jgi:hypothetical protein
MYLAIWQKGLFDRDKIRFPHRQTKEKKHVTSPERFKLEKYKKNPQTESPLEMQIGSPKKLILIS